MYTHFPFKLPSRTTTDRAYRQQQRTPPGTHKYELLLIILAISCGQSRLGVGGGARDKVGGIGVAPLFPRWLSAQIASRNGCARLNFWADAGRGGGVMSASRVTLLPCERQPQQLRFVTLVPLAYTVIQGSLCRRDRGILLAMTCKFCT